MTQTLKTTIGDLKLKITIDDKEGKIKIIVPKGYIGKDLHGYPLHSEDLSAIHIHKNNNNKPGNILFWISTSNEWQNGTLQNKENMNLPCCGNNNCNLIAPNDTLSTKDLIGKSTDILIEYKVPKKNISKCKPYKDFVDNFLVLHGKKFQQKNSDKYKPGLDVKQFKKLTR